MQCCAKPSGLNEAAIIIGIIITKVVSRSHVIITIMSCLLHYSVFFSRLSDLETQWLRYYKPKLTAISTLRGRKTIGLILKLISYRVDNLFSL